MNIINNIPERFYMLVGIMAVGFFILYLMSVVFYWIVMLLIEKFHPQWLDPNETIVTVTYNKSGIVANWHPRAKSVQRLAEKNGVIIKRDCDRGECAKCVKELKEGEYIYILTPKRQLSNEKMKFTCIMIPKTNIVINA